MTNKVESYQILGMRQDNLIGTGNSSKYAHEIKNMRLNTVGDYTTASWTTEEGTEEVNITWTQSAVLFLQRLGIETSELPVSQLLSYLTPVGQAVINNHWVIFGIWKYTSSKNITYIRDMIIEFYYNGIPFEAQILYYGNLGFNVNYPLETITYYENDNMRKVYWVDGLNQPRVINLACVKSDHDADNQFDFVKEVSLNESVTIEKVRGGNGLFPPCTVKYAITYYTKYGQESNIVYTSPLLYPTRGDRACSEDELSGDAFKVIVNNVDTIHQYDYIRLYSIVRTTNNATPIVRIVSDMKLPSDGSSVTFLDTNSTGEIVDPTILDYVGGRTIVASTFTQKDNTLFLGNIKLTDLTVDSVVSLLSEDDPWGLNTSIFIGSSYVHNLRFTSSYRKTLPITTTSGFYRWINQLNNSTSPLIFKSGETYRFGIQFQNSKGIWSEVTYLGDVINGIRPSFDSDGNGKFANLFYALPYQTAQILSDHGFKKARLVCCFPTNADRDILAQGTICQTLTNTKWANDHCPDNFSSWLYRFGYEEGIRVPLQELQSQVDDVPAESGLNVGSESEVLKSTDVWTFHSPDIEFDESLKTLDLSNVKVRLIGKAKQNSFKSNLYLEYSKKAVDYLGNKGEGLTNKSTSYGTEGDTGTFNQKTLSFGTWNDLDVYNSNYKSHAGSASENSKYQSSVVTINYPVYLFQRKYLNNYMGDTTIDIDIDPGNDLETTITESSVIDTKIWAGFGVCNLPTYYNNSGTVMNGLQDYQIFDSNEVIPLKLRGTSNSNPSNPDVRKEHIYYGNMNTIAPLHIKSNSESPKYVPIYEYQGLNSNTVTGLSSGTQEENPYIILSSFTGSYYISELVNNSSSETFPYTLNKIRKPYRLHFTLSNAVGVSSDPVQITYKSTPHGVFMIDTHIENQFPSMNLQDTTQGQVLDDEVYIAELYREVPSSNKFGGNTPEAILNNDFIPCSKAYSLEITQGEPLIMQGTEGDTYFMRYDNLKTYPNAPEDTNQVVDIFSFFCETRINLDGRYDENRGLNDNTLVTNTNFNKINQSYNQTDNFFVYHTLDELSTKLNTFPNQITWTKTKTSGEDVDTWTNITLANIADADGTVGKINKLLNHESNLYLFQDRGIAVVGYNEKTALSVENGVPLEIANSGKFTGFQYFTKEVGCINKWSISDTKNGILFIDDIRHELNIISQGIQSLSTINGFDAFMINNCNLTTWNPETFSNFVTYYDPLSKDIYYINNDYCLAWNEETKTFTSFYDYNGVPYMARVNNHFLMFKGGSIWAARESLLHSNFFGVQYPYWITVVCDGTDAFVADKVFNTIEFRADSFDRPEYLIRSDVNQALFTDISAWNSYQVYNEFPIDAIRKFGIWRATLPRASYRNANGVLYTNRDRIRNPFCYIKLMNNFNSGSNNTHRMVLHDLQVYYSMQ